MAPALLLATGAEVVPGESRPSSGLTVVLPATSARDLIARSRDGRVLVHGLILDQGQADTLHGEVAAVKASGLVSTSVRDGQPVLPYAEDMVDELVIDREALVDKTPAQAEIDRVLISRFGVARIREKGAWNDYRRPMPATYGEWTHYFHDATNNPVGEDNVATIATGVRWIADGQANGGSFQLVGGGRLIHFNREVRSNFTGCGGQTWATTRVQNAFNGLPLWETSAANWKEEYTQRYDRAVIDDDRLIHLRTRK
ncbi:MAG: Serine/threonine-protein kinase AfsK, partial [Planctomycetota bacterium]